ncbi:MAG: hypothetical protein JXR13_15750 [Thalassovita sp.]
MSEVTRDELVLSYVRVRRALGYLGLLFPFLLILGGYLSESDVLPSVSDYYHSTMRDIFVGSLFAIGVFLISYKGHPLKDGEKLSDDIVATIAGLSAFGVAIFPNEGGTGHPESMSQMILGLKIAAVGHYISAIIFLGSLAYFCLVKFAKTALPHRRRIYRACGWFILLGGTLATVASYYKVYGTPAQSAFVVENRLVLWVEALGIWAFGISWLTKGKAEFSRILPLLRHKPPNQKA